MGGLDLIDRALEPGIVFKCSPVGFLYVTLSELDHLPARVGRLQSGQGRGRLGRIGLDLSTRMAMNALFAPDREPDRCRPRHSPELDPVDELKRIVSAKWQLFRIQFLCAAPAGLSGLNEVEIRATDVSVAIVSAARLTFPPKTVAVRILDHESQIVFERRKADHKQIPDCALASASDLE